MTNCLDPNQTASIDPFYGKYANSVDPCSVLLQNVLLKFGKNDC